MLRLVINVLPAGNSLGKEKLQGKHADRTKSKACAVLRAVREYTPQQVVAATLTKRQKKAEALSDLWEVRPKQQGDPVL